MENIKKPTRLMCIVFAIIFAFAASIQPAEANVKEKIEKDSAVYYNSGNTYYLLDYDPPSRYGKEFGKEKNYTAAKKTDVVFKKTWKKKSTKKKVIKSLINFIKKGRFTTALGVIVSMVTENIKGVKIVKTTYYNKTTKKYKVGKNKWCRKEIWKIYLKEKSDRTGKYAWSLFHKEIGFRAVITVK